MSTIELNLVYAMTCLSPDNINSLRFVPLLAINYSNQNLSRPNITLTLPNLSFIPIFHATEQ